MLSTTQKRAASFLKNYFAKHLVLHVHQESNLASHMSKTQGQYVFASNHAAHIDGALLVHTLAQLVTDTNHIPKALMRPVLPSWLSKPLERGFEHLKMVVVDKHKPRDVYRRSERVLAGGENLLFFPHAKLATSSIDDKWNGLVFEQVRKRAEQTAVYVVPVTTQYSSILELEELASQGVAHISAYVKNRSWRSESFITFAKPVLLNSSWSHKDITAFAYNRMLANTKIFPEHAASYAFVNKQSIEDVCAYVTRTFPEQATSLTESAIRNAWPKSSAIAKYQAGLLEALQKHK
ncbi:MAG: hypothetical protein ACMXYD_02615 [Candidatus Woesearchaeota archaeon]